MKKYNEFVAFDLETTGLSPKNSTIIEIAGIKYKDGQVVDKFHSMVNPGYPIPFYITKVNGITDEMVKDAPSLDPVLVEFNKFCNGLPLVAHNAKFDMSFLYEYGKDFNNDVIDTLQLSREMFPFLPNHKLNTVVGHLGVTEGGFHRAFFDCQCCSKIYLEYIYAHLT